MSKENLIYNCSGEEYWEKLYQKEYNRLSLFEGRHGKYVGEIINGEIFNSKKGEYLGEIYKGRLIVAKSKIGKSKIKGNFMGQPFDRMGHVCSIRMPKIEIPEGYEDFKIGFSRNNSNKIS